MNIVLWIAASLSLIGAFLNARKIIYGFYLWIVANAIWLFEAFMRPSGPQWPLVVTWLLYTIISIHGIVEWRKKDVCDSMSKM